MAFDACGVGMEGIDDTMLEALTRKGDGRYYVINSPAEANDLQDALTYRDAIAFMQDVT